MNKETKKYSIIKMNLIGLKYVFKFCPVLLVFAILKIIASTVMAIVEVDLISNAIKILMNGEDVNKLYTYLQNFPLKDRMNELYDLAFKMSIATRGDKIEDLEKYKKDIENEELYSNVIGPEGITITSLVRDNKIFMCLPKDERSDYSRMLQSKDKQRKFCEYLSDEVFYNVLIFLYSRNGTNFTETLLIDNLNITYEEAKSVLQKMVEFEIVVCSDVPINDTTMQLYATIQNPQIVGMIAMLDMIVNRPKCYYYYFGGPNNYFKKN